MNNKVLSAYDYFLIAGVIGSNALYSFFSHSFDALGSIAGIAGVLCVVLVAKGNIWNYAFGLVNVSLYAYISFKASLYGDAGLNALYYLPMQFIGWYSWKKRGASVKTSIKASGQDSCADSAETRTESKDTRVRARRMTALQRTALACACIAAVVVFGLVLRHFGDPQPFKDSATTVLSIVAQALMAMAFMEQWVLWIITNVLSVLMWCICVARGEAHAGVMVIMWTFYLLNSINGLRIWLKLSKD